jgi:hypothetical protein
MIDTSTWVLGMGAPVGVPATGTLETFSPGCFDQANIVDVKMTSRRHDGRQLAHTLNGSLVLWIDDESGDLYFAGDAGTTMAAFARSGRLGASIAYHWSSKNGLHICRLENVTEVTLCDRLGKLGPRPGHRSTWVKTFGEAPKPLQAMALHVYEAWHARPATTPRTATKPARRPAAAPRQRGRTLGGSAVPQWALDRVRAARYRGLSPELLASV